MVLPLKDATNSGQCNSVTIIYFFIDSRLLRSCNNLRPISNTPLPTKILEKHVNKEIYEYMESNKLFFMHQNGFRKGKSTIRAVNNIANKLYEYKNNGEYSIAIFLDLSKAFNCVNHDILCMNYGSWNTSGIGNSM